MSIEGASDLHRALYTAIEAQDVDAFNGLVQHHWPEIVAQFDSWASIPASIRDDQEAASRYVQSIVAIAQALDAAGRPAFLQRLIGPDETNPIVQWNRRLRSAQALSEAGEYDESSRQLEKVLASMERAEGSAVMNLRPKIFGRLAFNALQKQEHAAALAHTRSAYAASVAAGDEEGRVAYYENLMSLRAIHALEAEPERGRRLLDVRRLIARAQDAADAGHYQASKETLARALTLIHSERDDELLQALLPKVHGLLGYNEFRLGNVSKAREHSAIALKESEAIEDADGVRIYTANLEVIDRG